MGRARRATRKSGVKGPRTENPPGVSRQWQNQRFAHSHGGQELIRDHA
jgi:hypothetical protein